MNLLTRIRTLRALRPATEPELQDVMKTLRATKLEILWNVGLPRTMPYFFASLKVAATLAFWVLVCWWFFGHRMRSPVRRHAYGGRRRMYLTRF